jgi:hypothetical protein
MADIKVELNDAKKRNINIKNVNALNGVKVVRQREPSISSSDSGSYSDSSYSSSSSSESARPKKTKKILRKKEYRTDYNAFSNPKKMTHHETESEYSEMDSESGSGSDSGSEAGSVDNEQKNWEDRQKLKQDLLIKIQALEAKGFEFSKKFTMSSNYDDMLYEYEKIKKFIETQAGIKMARRALMACVTGLEFLNRKFDPFNLKLDGWSENVMESVEDYDNVFERLIEKYSSSEKMAPELELLITLGGSAFMFHLTNIMFKSGSVTNGPIAQNNPNFMASMMSSMSQAMKQASKPPDFKSGPNFKNKSQENNSFPAPIETRGQQRKEMRGPSVDPSLFNGTPLASNHPNQVNYYPVPPMYQKSGSNYYDPNPINEDDRFSIASSSEYTSSSSSASSTPLKKNIKKGRKGGIELNIS